MNEFYDELAIPCQEPERSGLVDGTMNESLVDALYNVVGKFYDEPTFDMLEKALKHYEEIMQAVETNSLAKEGMEMIEAAMREER